MRQFAYERTFEEWKTDIFSDISKAHPDIRKLTTEMNIWLWGHGMIKPSPGFIWSDNRINASLPVDNKVFFAHADLGGISIFEEAFYHGHQAAKNVLTYAIQ
jgi:hypothetical protein